MALANFILSCEQKKP